MFYLGHPNSFTEIHVEDSYLESLNILRSGSPKIWIIVDRNSYSRFNDSLSKDLYRIPSYGKPVCYVPVQHKDTVVSPRWLDENNIPCQIFVQYPGDLLFVRTAVPHQVWDVGHNLAEAVKAVNYGSMEWNHANAVAFFCHCPKKSIVKIASNTFARSKTIPMAYINVCSWPDIGCQESFRNKTELDVHRTSRHGMKHNCTMCEKKISHRTGLSRHVRKTHKAIR